MLSTTVDALTGRTEIPTPDDPAAALAAVVARRRLADRLERAAVARAVEQGWTWAQVAEALGVTRQAAHKRHAGRRD
jgi:hypothetical protein